MSPHPPGGELGRLRVLLVPLSVRESAPCPSAPSLHERACVTRDRGAWDVAVYWRA